MLCQPVHVTWWLKRERFNNRNYPLYLLETLGFRWLRPLVPLPGPTLDVLGALCGPQTPGLTSLIAHSFTSSYAPAKNIKHTWKCAKIGNRRTGIENLHQVGTKIGPVPDVYRKFPDFTQCVFVFYFWQIFKTYARGWC